MKKKATSFGPTLVLALFAMLALIGQPAAADELRMSKAITAKLQLWLDAKGALVRLMTRLQDSERQEKSARRKLQGDQAQEKLEDLNAERAEAKLRYLNQTGGEPYELEETETARIYAKDMSEIAAAQVVSDEKEIMKSVDQQTDLRATIRNLSMSDAH